MSMNAQEYYKAVQNIDRTRALQELNNLPDNLDPNGRTFKKRLREIEEKHNVKL